MEIDSLGTPVATAVAGEPPLPPPKPRRQSLSHLPPRETRQTVVKPDHAPMAMAAAPAEPPPPRLPSYNPFLPTLDMVDFPSEDWRDRIQPDDLKDGTLMLIAGALATCSNRALCPKEVAEVMMYRGWSCNGTQPFAIVSTCIRKHLQRRGFGITNSSHGKPARPGLPPPLFASYELSGPPVLLSAIGIDPDAKPATKRSTLWYLSEEGTGYKSPFGELDPNVHISNIPEPPKPKAPSVPRARPTTAPTSEADPFSPLASTSMGYARQESPEDGLTMGRGKRKRKVSGIAGGDAAWHASSVPSRTGLSPLAESDDEGTPPPPTPAMPPLGSSLPEKSNIRRIRVRLGASHPADGPILSTVADTEDETSDVEAIQQRRFKKRSKSEGSLLSLTASFPAQPARGLWSAFRSNGGHSAATSVASGDLRLERLHEDMDDDDDDEDSPVVYVPPPRTIVLPGGLRSDEQDDFHEAMLKPDFDFDFDFPGHRRGVARTVGSPVDIYDTPATTPRSWSGSVKEALDADLYEQASANHASGAGARLMLATTGDAAVADVTLSDVKLSTSPDRPPLSTLISPAPDLPQLPLESAAKTMGFAPAIGDPDEVLSPSAVDSPAPSMFSHRSFSPASSFASPSISREATPMSEDSFEAELVVKSELSPEYAFDSGSSPMPIFDDEDTFGQEDVEPFVSLEKLDMAELDLVRWDGSGNAPAPVATPVKRASGRKLRSGKTTGLLPTLLPSSPLREPPTPFGPEVFGYTSLPAMQWKPFSSLSASPEDRFNGADPLELIAAEDASQSTAVPDVEMAEVRPAKIVAPIRRSPSPSKSEPLVVKATNRSPSPPSSPVIATTSKTRKGKEERSPTSASENRSSHRRTSSRLSRK